MARAIAVALNSGKDNVCGGLTKSEEWLGNGCNAWLGKSHPVQIIETYE